MKPLGPDIIATLLQGFSWCVSKCAYDLQARVFVIRVVDDPEKVRQEREMHWAGILDFEVMPNDADDIDDMCMDAVIGLHETSRENRTYVFIHTDKYEIQFSADRPVVVQDCQSCDTQQNAAPNGGATS